jgi:ubiquinone/menaquinone biosynthesis C-methylase UbiE
LRFTLCGAEYTGIDLTEKAVELTKKKIGDKGTVYQMNAEDLDFPSNYFDLVYSFGVIHHAVNPDKIMKEIHRVLKPTGHTCIMLYNKYSLKYLWEIMTLRKSLWLLHYHRYNKIRQSIPNPTREQWVSINTDNLGCPLSRVYTAKQAKSLLKGFRNIVSWTENKGWFRMLIGTK